MAEEPKSEGPPRIVPSAFLNGHVPEPDWLVPSILHKGQIVVLAGEAGAGKSFLGYTLAMAVATGSAFLGVQCSQAPVVCFDDENSIPDMQAYLYKIWCGMGKPDVVGLDAMLRLEQYTLSLAGSRWHESMKAVLKERQPGLALVDTVGSCFGLEDENDNGLVATAMRKIRWARAAAPPSCTIVLYLHGRSGKKGHKDIRGAKRWKGEADAVLYLSRMRGRPTRDGLTRTILEPLKVRSFGLRERLCITPINTPPSLTLSAKPLQDDE